MSTARPPIDWRRRIGACALVLLVTAAGASQTPASAAGPASSLEEVGHGRLSWPGFHIDAARRWSTDGRLSGFEPGRPIALSLADERGLSRAALLKITTGELARLGLADPDARLRWAALLGTFRRDVGRGDNLTALVVPGGETRRYGGTRLLGAIDGPAFGPAYLSIGRDPRSAVRDLRSQLLGRAGR